MTVSMMRGNVDSRSLSYREDIVSAAMNCIAAGESCSLVGISGIGKSALLRHVSRTEVKGHFLGESSSRFLFVVVDCNLIAEVSEWGAFEFFLNQIARALDSIEDPALGDLVQQLNGLYSEVEAKQDRFLAQRHLSRSVGLILKNQFDKIVFFLDEFDGVLRQIDSQFLNNLRGLRDEYRPQVVYVTLTRHLFPLIRQDVKKKAESFFEIFRNTFALAPYNREQAHHVLLELMADSKFKLEESGIRYVVFATGGHSGLIKGAFEYLRKRPLVESKDMLIEMAEDSVIRDESRKIWGSLTSHEQRVLSRVARGELLQDSDNDIVSHLKMKGVLTERSGSGLTLFSPLFAFFIKQQLPQHASS